MKVKGRLIQAHFIKIHQFFVNKRNKIVYFSSTVAYWIISIMNLYYIGIPLFSFDYSIFSTYWDIIILLREFSVRSSVWLSEAQFVNRQFSTNIVTHRKRETDQQNNDEHILYDFIFNWNIFTTS